LEFPESFGELMAIHQCDAQIILADGVDVLSVFHGNGRRVSGGFSVNGTRALGVLACGG
jgi:hypothetical protein